MTVLRLNETRENALSLRFPLIFDEASVMRNLFPGSCDDYLL